MEIRAERVGVDGPHGVLLAPTSLRVATGELTLVSGQPGSGHTALALALAGRLRHDRGEVRLDGRADLDALRRAVAVVDSVDTTEPDDVLPLAAVVAEELTIAGAGGGRRSVRRWLAGQDAERFADERVDQLPAELRIRLLSALAAGRPGVRALVFDSPDRHTADPHGWWSMALKHAGDGLAVVAISTPAATRQLPVPAAHIGEHHQPEPVRVATPEETHP